MAEKIDVFVADSQFLFAEALSLALIKRYGEALDVSDNHPTTGTDVILSVTHAKPDVALLDYNWADGMVGPVVTRALAEHAPGTRVVHLAWFHDPGLAREALEAGACGFLSKALLVADIADAIFSAGKWDLPLLEPEMKKALSGEPAVGRFDASVGNRLRSLTPREIECLRMIALGFQTKQIAKEAGVKPQTVRKQLYRVMAKLGVDSRAHAVAVAREQGLFP